MVKNTNDGMQTHFIVFATWGQFFIRWERQDIRYVHNTSSSRFYTCISECSSEKGPCVVQYSWKDPANVSAQFWLVLE